MQTIINLQPEKLKALENAVEAILSVDLLGSGKDFILHFCIRKGYHMSIIELLLSCGEFENCMNEECLTPSLYCRYTK